MRKCSALLSCVLYQHLLLKCGVSSCLPIMKHRTPRSAPPARCPLSPPPRPSALPLLPPPPLQVFAQLIELRAKPLPAIYMAIFPPLLSPVFWERSGNVPALVRLIQVKGKRGGS